MVKQSSAGTQDVLTYLETPASFVTLNKRPLKD
uniref:Uncharacterized protein n=1 Tax=Anguilla anguilla TaxID=7936 RepID=A0A0E9U3J4_ANGAN